MSAHTHSHFKKKSKIRMKIHRLASIPICRSLSMSWGTPYLHIFTMHILCVLCFSPGFAYFILFFLLLFLCIPWAIFVAIFVLFCFGQFHSFWHREGDLNAHCH